MCFLFYMLVFLSPLNYNNISEVRMSIVELIESFLGPLNSEFGKLIISVVFISFFTIALGFIGISKLLIFLSVLVSIFMFVGFGWLPIWLVVAVGVGIFVLGYINLRGGSNV
jgi:hypothetical protein